MHNFRREVFHLKKSLLLKMLLVQIYYEIESKMREAFCKYLYVYFITHYIDLYLIYISAQLKFEREREEC